VTVFVRGLSIAAAFLLVLGACSSSTDRPARFDGMSSDEVGCVITYGDDDPYAVGPLGPSDSEEIHPNDYTSFRIARTASDLIIVVEQPESGSTAQIPLAELPADGMVARGPFRNGGNPGYEITCQRGTD